MAQSPDVHFKLLLGELAGLLSLARAENEELRETIAVLRNPPKRIKPVKE